MRLQEIKEKDYQYIEKLTTNINLMKYIQNGKIWSSEKIEKFIQYCIADSKLDHYNRDQYWYIIKNNDKENIGMIGFEKHSDKNYYLRVIIEEQYQGKGYFKCALDLIKNRLRNYKKVDKLYAEAHKDNLKMNSILSDKHYFYKISRYGNKLVNTYIIFLRNYTYLVKSDYISDIFIDTVFATKGNWKKHTKGSSPDYIRLDGKHYYDRKYDNYRSILKNIVNGEKKLITEKSNLFKNLGNKPYIPQTYTFKYFEEFKKIAQKLISDDRAWIFKPDNGYAGEGIFISKKEDFKNIKFSKYPYWSMQEYIKNPYLIDNKKFHMRVLYLYRARGEGFWFKKIPLYLAKKDFVYQNFLDDEIHISHYDSNSKARYFENLNISKASKVRLIKNIDIVVRDLTDVIKNAACYPSTQNCYEIFGIDFMLTDKLELKLIEVNRKVGFKEFKNDDFEFNKCLFVSETEITADYFLPPKIKTRLYEYFRKV